MNGLVKRLREAASEIAGWGAGNEAAIVREGIAAIEERGAEISRLREALDYYAANHEWPNEGPWGVDSTDFGNVARAALQAQRHGDGG